MEMITHIWSWILMYSPAILYAGAAVILILLEKHFIQKRSRWEKRLPVIALIAAVVLTPMFGQWHESRDSGLGSTQVFKGNQEIGHLIVVYDGERQITALGQYVTRQGKHSDFIDLEVVDDKIVAASRPIDCREEIEEQLSYFKGKYTGRSQFYGDLIEIGQQNEYHRTFFKQKTLLFEGFWFAAPGLITLFMYLDSQRRRKRRNAYNRTKLEDL